MGRLTERELACLRYLDPLMEATPHMIGAALDGGDRRTPRGNAMVGHGVARLLQYQPSGCPALVAWLPDLRAYRITPAGRAALRLGEAS